MAEMWIENDYFEANEDSYIDFEEAFNEDTFDC